MVFPLGALIAGDPAGAYNRSRLSDLELQDLQDQQLAGNLLGGAIQSLVPGATPMPGAQPSGPMLDRYRALGMPPGGSPPMPYGLSSPMGPAPPQGAPPMGGPPMAAAGPSAGLTPDILRTAGMSRPAIGSPAQTVDDRWAPVTGALAGGQFDPQGVNAQGLFAPGGAPRAFPLGGGPPGGAAPGAARAAAPYPLPAAAPPASTMARA